MDFLAAGTGSMINNASYYYHRYGSNILIRYDLDTTEQIQSDSLGAISYLDCNFFEFKNKNLGESFPVTLRSTKA